MVMDLSQNQPEQEKKNPNISFEKVEEIAILNRTKWGTTVELNKVSYNGREAVYDLRNWTPEGEMRKGITLTDQTLANLLIALKNHLEGGLSKDESDHLADSDITAHLPNNF